VIRGETYHFEVVVGEERARLMALTLDGLRDRQRHPDRRERAAGAGPSRSGPRQQGRHAAEAALRLFDLREQYAP
jgi:6,7-dimethyl-8-ribityllumazine synthase